MNRNDTSARASVLVVGAGPVGLSMALGLARHGVRSVLVERKKATSRTSKAPGIHVRTREVFRQWAVEDRILDAGALWESLTMHSVVPGRRPLLTVDFAELADEVDRPGLLILEQNELERILLEAVRESGMCEVRFESEVIGLEQDGDGVTVTLREGGGDRTLDADFVVGCDGAGSFVREALALPFDGMTYALRPMLADVRVADERDSLPQPRAWTGAGGFAFAVRLRPGLWRLVHVARGEPVTEEVADEEVREQVDRLLGPGPAELKWASRFRIHVRASPRFRVGRVVLAGDAAHVHSPAAGFGMNGGIQDAHNLAWKVAFALRGADTDRLLDSYEVERRAVVVETTSRHTDRITRIFIEAPAIVREMAWFLLRMVLRIPRLRRMNLRRVAMIDLDYPPSPLLMRSPRAAGVRLPNPVLRAPDGTAVRLYELLPNAPAIIELAAKKHEPATEMPLEPVIRIGPGGYEERAGRLRGIVGGEDGWILVRPNAHIAWAGSARGDLDRAVSRAFGEGVPPGAT